MNRRDIVQIVLVFGEGFLMLLSGGLLFVLISRLAGPEMLGKYSLVIAWLAVFQAVGGFGIPEFILREMGAHGKQGGRHVAHGLILACATSLVSAFAMFGGGYLFGYSGDVSVALPVACIAVLPMTCAQICRAGFLADGQMLWVVVVAFIETAIVMVVSTYLLIGGHGVLALVVTLVCAKTLGAIAALYLFTRHVVRIRWEFDRNFARSLVGPVLAFGVSNSLGIIASRGNIIMLSFWSNMSVVGHYAAANKVMEIALIGPNLLAQFLMPRIARAFSRTGTHDLASFEPLFRAIFSVTMPLGIGAIIYADVVISVLFGESFADVVWVLRLLMLFYLIEVMDALMGVILKTAGRQKLDAQIFSSNPGVNIALNFMLIPTFGALGAAAAKVAGVVTSTCLRYVAIGRFMAVPRWWAIAAVPVLLCAAIGGSLRLLNPLVHEFVLAIVYVVVCAVVLFPMIKRSIADAPAQ